MPPVLRAQQGCSSSDAVVPHALMKVPDDSSPVCWGWHHTRGVVRESPDELITTEVVG